jgi:hypothetical protein
VLTPPAWQQRQVRFFALDHPHEIARGLHIQLLALVVTDHRSCGAALSACVLRGTDDFLDTRQILGQALPPRMRASLPRWRLGERHAPYFGLHLIQSCARLFIGQQVELQIV